MPLSPRERGARWASTLVLTVVVFAQAPGKIVPETKFDVTVDPIGYLARALSAWDPSAAFGRVQNQAIGYAFPMGAFSALGEALAIPPWITQRLWIALVLSVGLWGAHRAARAVGIATAGGRLVAAWAYALAPATLSVAAFQSAGQLPYAVAPHVLVPLLRARPGDSPRRVAAASALWIVAMGGVNGASALAVLPLVGWWFATRAPGRDRRRLVAWWSACTLGATLWWLIPLLVSVRYGIRFTDFTEQAVLTTATESATEVWRGSGNWLAYVQTPMGWWLPGGRALTADRLAIVGSIAVAAGGAWGLARRDLPGRRWLVPAAVTGAVVIGIGYAGAGGGPLSEPVQALLDGPLTPFRNVHKFAAVLRLPLALGAGHLVAVASRAEAPRRLPRFAPAALALVAIVAAATPALAGKLTAPGAFEAVPAPIEQAARWIDDQPGDDRTLLVPGSAFAEYRWGRPLDEPISTSLEGTWAVRDLIPLGGIGSTRLLDGIESALATESLPAGFTSTLQRAGVGYLLVRNDLDLARTGAPTPQTVRRVLRSDDQLELVASFGPIQTRAGTDGRLAAAPGEADAEAFRSVDVYRVPSPSERATATPLDATAVFSGGPEGLLEVPPDLLEGRAAVLGADALDADLEGGLVIATDSARRRDVEFGAIRNNATATLTPDAASPTTGAEPRDRWPTGSPEGLTSARLLGAAELRSSEGPGRLRRPEWQPFAAFDGDAATAWVPSGERTGEWLEVRLDAPQELGSVRLELPRPDGRRIGTVRVRTDGGSVLARFDEEGRATVDLPPGPTRSVRFTVEEIVGSPRLGAVGISEIDLDGLALERPLVLPAPAGRPADVASMARARRDQFSLTRRDEDATLDRIVELRGGPASLSGTAKAVGGPALQDVVEPSPAPGAVDAAASSHLRDHPAFDARAVLDGSPRTAWVSEPEAPEPTLELSWDGPVLVDGFELTTIDLGLDPIEEVAVDAGGTVTTVRPGPDGWVSLPPTTTDHLRLRFPAPGGPAAPDEAAGRQVAVAEVEVPALIGRPAVRYDRDQPIELACGTGPTIAIDGEPVRTALEATVGDVLDGRAVTWTACDPIDLDPGVHQLSSTADAFTIDDATLRPTEGPPAPDGGRATTIEAWGDTARTVAIEGGDEAILSTTENFNDGWEATADGQVLTPIRVDGWRQGWIVPAGDASTISLRYRPATAQRAGLLAGLAAIAALVAAALVRPRRSGGWELPAERRWARAPALGLLALAGLALSPVAILAAIAFAASGWCRRHAGAIAAGAIATAGVVAFVQAGAAIGSGRGTFAATAQAAAAAAVVAVAATLLDDLRAPAVAAGSTPPSPAPSARLRSPSSTTPEGSG